jgi:hypothetical protein
MPDTSTPDAQLRSAILRLNGRIWGWAFGLVFGTTLWIATLILVVKGGNNVGQHLSLLAVYFPGYSVTVLGAFIGFVYAFVVGYGSGRLIGVVYNWGIETR